MSNKKSIAFRGLRKSANITRKISTKAANFSGRVEQKADRIIHGTDPTIKIHDKILFEKIFAEAIPEITPIHPALPLAGRKACVTLLIPSLQRSSFFGGTATALIFAGMIAKKKGMALRIVETLQHGAAKESSLVTFFKSSGISFKLDEIKIIDISARRYNHYGYLDIHPQDEYVASAWWDAYLLDQLPLLKKYIYLIQDYEPIFYNNSDKYVLSEQTYRSTKFIPVCNTELMYKFMCSKGYKNIESDALWFEPAVAVAPKAKKKSVAATAKRKMFIYGRPSVARNLFFFTLMCVDEVFTNYKLVASDWEIYMAGQDNLADMVLSSGVTVKNLGKMDMAEYHALVQDTDLAISPMMAPHPNYPTLEFASAGAVVVTTKYETKQNLSMYSENIIISDLDKDSFTNAIVKAANRKPSQAVNSSRISADWQSSLKNVIAKL
ncbi:MAG: hypothetical protein ACR2FM_00210 [Candidatus Saccharimonadales bacterium]